MSVAVGDFNRDGDPDLAAANTYRAGDGALSSGVATVTLTVAAVNNAPEVEADAYAADEDTPLTVDAPACWATTASWSPRPQ